MTSPEAHLLNSIVEETDKFPIERNSLVIELSTAKRLFQYRNEVDFVFGFKGRDRACKVKLFADREKLNIACQQYANTKAESLTVRIEITLL